jgi:hypothetical protein
LIYASISNNIPATIQIIPSTNEFSIIFNHTAIYINPSGIPTIIAQVIKNLNNRITSTSMSFVERTRLFKAIFVLFLIASNTCHHSSEIIITTYCQRMLAITTISHHIQIII